MPRFLHGTNQTDTSSRFSSTVNITHRERKNGWSCPWHPLQLVAWVFIVYFAITYFGILVFYLPLEWRPAGWIIPGGLYAFHIVIHILALSIDPADPNLRQGQSLGKAEFDRNDHSHVIENNHCYICQVDVFPKSKHCSSCNKCVSEFDHHCKWLNTCVGGRNYKLFLSCIVSAFAGAVIMAAVTLYLFICFFIRKRTLLKSQVDEKFYLFVPVSDTAFIVFVGINEALYLLAICLLGHLIGFHLYLIYLNMSTYEFIVNSRERKQNTQADVSCEGTPMSLNRSKNNKVLPTPDEIENGEISAESQHERMPSPVNQESEATVKVMNEISSKVAKRNSNNALYHKPPNEAVDSSPSSSVHALATTLQDRTNRTAHSDAIVAGYTEMTGICRGEELDLQTDRITVRNTRTDPSNEELSDSDGEELIPISEPRTNQVNQHIHSNTKPKPRDLGDQLPVVTRPLPHLGTYSNMSSS